MSQNPLDLFPHHPLEFDMVMDLKSYTLINVIPPGKKSSMLNSVFYLCYLQTWSLMFQTGILLWKILVIQKSLKLIPY